MLYALNKYCEATFFADLSKSNDGTYPYNTFVVLYMVEALKMLSSAFTLVSALMRGYSMKIAFLLLKFYSVRKACLLLFYQQRLHVLYHSRARVDDVSDNKQLEGEYHGPLDACVSHSQAILDEMEGAFITGHGLRCHRAGWRRWWAVAWKCLGLLIRRTKLLCVKL